MQVKSQAQLGANTIGAGHQHRLLVTLWHFEQRAETTNAAQYALAQGLLGQRLDTFDECITGIDIDASITVGEGSILGHGQLGAKRQQTLLEKTAILPETVPAP